MHQNKSRSQAGKIESSDVTAWDLRSTFFSRYGFTLPLFFVRPPLQTAICYHSTVITAGHALAYGALPQRKCNEDLFCYFGSFHISKYATESMLNSTPLPIIIMLPSSFQTFQTHNYSVSKAPTSEFRLTIMLITHEVVILSLWEAATSISLLSREKVVCQNYVSM